MSARFFLNLVKKDDPDMISDIHKIIGEQIENSTNNTSHEEAFRTLFSIKPMLKELQDNVFFKSIVECATQKPISKGEGRCSLWKFWMSQMQKIRFRRQINPPQNC
ncbi:hypothetical protein RF11_05455 [Thelohanellus kitauei]|uniref:Uncharacterized protein n=1 Tax=Thelohanellus kitauei TaxID=669202 RepID=A0A0C2N2W2_THEKT|nr:hypothetical protein RF11_05455 [Thelohanellus kitauei]